MQSIVAESFKIKVVEAFKYDIEGKEKKTFPGTNVFPNITDASAHTLQDLGVMIICHLL